MATRIQPVVALWGTAEDIEADPGIEVRQHAVYVPASGTAPHALAPGSGGIETAPDATYMLVEGMTEHYGHFIVDCLSRFWPLTEAGATPVKLVCEPRHGRDVWERHAFLREILAGLGLGLDDIVTFAQPIVLPRVVRAAPSFRPRESVHAVFGDLCRKVGRRYWSEDEVDSVGRPAYLSKSRLTSGMQHFANEAEVVGELARLGADIVFPEEMTFAEQVREFARRRVVLGPVGSAFHTSAFSAPARRMIGLSGMACLNSNYVLVDRVSGARSDYYFVPETTYSDKDGFGLSWTIPDSRSVAAQLMARAEALGGLEAGAGQARGLPGLFRRARYMARARWSRARPPDRDAGR